VEEAEQAAQEEAEQELCLQRRIKRVEKQAEKALVEWKRIEKVVEEAQQEEVEHVSTV
jgi:hypothetical protein